MGIEHERIHIETSSVIIRRLPIEMVRPLPLWSICRDCGPAPENELLPVAGGRVMLGKPRNDPLYGWDNEYGRHQTDVWDFAASRYLVSNQEFLGFIEDGGYENPEHSGRKRAASGWSSRRPSIRCSGSKRTAVTSSARWPRSSTCPGTGRSKSTSLRPRRFAIGWRSRPARPIRLPTEAEWRRLHDLHDIPDQPYWEKAPGNINLEHWASSCPVDRFRFGEFYDLIGNVWQWTETPITGFDGFEIHPYYDDFSTPTFDTRHNLIKGGSWISTGNEAIRDSRYAFRRHFFQHAGLRYVESEQPVAVPEAMYESDAAVSQYCEAHFGQTYYNVPNFMVQCAAACLRHTDGRPRRKALDLGCAVGRGTFELARKFESVTGIDFSARFIRIALQLKEKGVAYYDLIEEGEIVSYHEARLADAGLEPTSSIAWNSCKATPRTSSRNSPATT